MKKIIMPILILVIIFLSGCYTGKVTINYECKEPYTIINNTCCLDLNKDQKCDSINEILNSTKVVYHKNIKELCEISQRFECLRKEINSTSIKLVLRNKKAGIASITKIEFPALGCVAYYNGTVEEGFDYQEDKAFIINCKIKDNYIETPINIEANIYKPTNIRGLKLMPYTKFTISAIGNISGMVS